MRSSGVSDALDSVQFKGVYAFVRKDPFEFSNRLMDPG